MDPFDVGLTIAQDPYLSSRHTEMHAVLRVTAGRPGRARSPADAPAGAPATLAEVLIIDCSGSMSVPSTKISAAKYAARVAVDVLPDGALFAIVRGDHRAAMVYPRDRQLATASGTTRREARHALERETAGGGTAIGTWLTLSRDLLAPHTTAVRHALLLTDGRNESEPSERLGAVLAECTGQFVCDPRGVGDGWEPAELVRIAAELRGTADAVARPQDLADDFRRTVEAATGKVLPDLRLRIATSTFDRLLYCKQVNPSVAELAGEQAPSAEGPLEVSLGAWGEETREYHLCFEVAPGGRPQGEDQRVARIDVVADRPLATGPVLVLVHWTEDPVKSSQIDPDVARVTDQQQLAHAINDGCRAYDRGDRVAAERHWGEAVRLATAMGNAGKLEDLSMFVRIVDGAAGRVELRPHLSVLDVKRGALRSLMTEIPEPPAPPEPPGHAHARPPVPEKEADAAPPPEAPRPPVPGPDGSARACPACGRAADAGHGFCQGCGKSLGGAA